MPSIQQQNNCAEQTEESSPSGYKDYFGVDVNVIKREIEIPQGKRKGPRGGVVVPFPVKLYNMLEGTKKEGLEHVVSWQPHGRCFMVHEPTEFVEDILPRYFRQSKLTSFQRQLNLYGFQRLVNGDDRGGYYHELFLNGRPDICKIILRTRVKGSCMKPSPLHEQEPDLYTFQRCSVGKASKQAAVVESSSDEMSVKEHQQHQQQDDASTHSSESASTLGPMPTLSTPVEIQTTLEAITEDKAVVYPATIPSMPFHIVTDDQEFVDTNEIPELPTSDWEMSITPMEDQIPSAEPMPVPPTLLPVTPDQQVSSRRVSVDEMAVFEGRSFQCIDETTLKSMEAVLIAF